MPTELYASIGARLKNLRRDRRMSQEELAEKTGLTPGFLSFLETGSKRGSLDTYARLALGLGVPLFELFREDKAAKTDKRGAAPVYLDGLSLGETQAVYQVVRAFRKGQGKRRARVK